VKHKNNLISVLSSTNHTGECRIIKSIYNIKRHSNDMCSYTLSLSANSAPGNDTPLSKLTLPASRIVNASETMRLGVAT
jgi:hypothetical protein